MTKLSKEERSAIAKAATAKRWAKKNQEPTQEPSPDSGQAESEEKHCPACMEGQSLEEGEGTHILATVEHPVTLPAAFADAEASVAIVEPPKPKQKSRSMPKELRSASSYAERRLPKAIQEKADLIVELQRKEAEIQELTRVIQALRGQTPVGIQNGYQPNNGVPYMPQIAPQPQLPPLYPEYQQPAPQLPVVTIPKAMKAGGAGVAQGMLEVPAHWYNEG